MPFRAFGDSDASAMITSLPPVVSVSMPFRAFGDSDFSMSVQASWGHYVSMPFRAFGDSDALSARALVFLSTFRFNALSGIRGF